MLNRHWKLLLFIFFIVVLVFSPSFFADICRIDDGQLLKRLHRITNFDFINLIRGGTGLYYRPLIATSYKLDAFLFNANVFGMHAENIVLHALNVVLLVAVLRRVFPSSSGPYIPYLCALIWGIHPITTESVAWISGRSDVLASTFILLATLFLLRYKQSSKVITLLLTLVFFLLGVLTKEVMLPFLVVTLLLLRTQENKSTKRDQWSLLEGRGLLMWLLPVVATGFFFLRFIAYNATSNRIVYTLLFIFNDAYHSLFVCLRALGFYVKKLVQPFPLSFALLDVDPLYELLAIPVVALCVVLLFKRDKLSALFLGGVALLTPAFLIAFNQIAWTPYAERYLYLPSAFMLPGIIGYVHHHLEFPSQRFKNITVVLLLLLLAVGTFHRNLVWQSSLSLFADTAQKSPYSREVQAIYASILIDAKQYDQAIVFLNKSRKLSTLGYYPKPDILEAKIYEKKDQIDRAVELLRLCAEKSHYRSAECMSALIKILAKSCTNLKLKQCAMIYAEMRELHLNKFRLKHRFADIFEMAELSVKLGEYERARALYRQFLRNVEPSSALALRAEKGLTQLPQP